MGRPHEREIEELGRVFTSARTSDLGGLIRVIGEITGGPAVFVASGGARAVAELSAQMHRSTGQAAWAATPMDFLATPPQAGVTPVVLTASGRNVDARAAVRHALAWESPAVVVTTAPRERLHREVLAPGVRIVRCQAPRDGFLATASTLAVATSMVRAYGYDGLPDAVPWIAAAPSDTLPVDTQLIVLFTPTLASAAIDLETRLSETGLRTVQLTDLRNFAHGRHVGLARNSPQTGVVVFGDPSSSPVVKSTVALLKAHEVLVINTPFAFPYGAVDILAASAVLTGRAGADAGMDVGRPVVSPEGRRLYSLRTALPRARPSAIDRKRVALPLGVRREEVETAYTQWRERIGRARFGGLVLDYDGTCCLTDARFDPLDEQIATEITRLVRGGLVLGFASGRGRSLVKELRAALPHAIWPDVVVGMYNGYRVQTLDTDPPDPGPPRGQLARAARRVGSLRDLGFTIRVREGQVQVEGAEGQAAAGSSILPMVTSLLRQPPVIRCSAFASAHSVDLVDVRVSKIAVVDEVARRTPGEVMAIGDQAGPFGNDSDLLAAREWSLSVGSCSADLSRCWRLEAGVAGGPPLLEKYLEALRHGSDGWRFEWEPE